MFEFIKAVSDTVLDMMYAAYHNQPLILTRATFQGKAGNTQDTYHNISYKLGDDRLSFVLAN